MAGDWLKVEKDTPDKPEILALASLLSMTSDEAFGKCFRLWRWADSHLLDGNATCVTSSAIDALVGRHGFADALLEVGWLQARNGSLAIPNFDRHISQSAKQRALTAKRVSQHKRRNGNGEVTAGALPREEKRRDKETPTPFPDCLDTERFRVAWSEWKAHRLEIRKPLKPTQARKQLAMLADIGEQRAVVMIAHTIEKGWQGLREPDRAGNALTPVPVASKPPSEVPKYIPKARFS
jgi:hypothetical protein